ncbi:MAG: branched-chain amino acid ABC transporter permease [Acidimicrobiaceae bacterium]|nr:branched-chain amino acid ABC transporter permease [Acidimicrobiaceae bacterium]MYG98524.1 branched-chain amino acid ABC transporter permease [Acidimicrobiaceae bacterium]MYL03396.1 branched-chain amino acid ABC transporter permease [Acidimicrobiaceae bacterium]
MTNPIFWVGVLTLAAIYASLAMALNVESGWGGMWDLGIAGLLAAGSYCYVILTADPDLGMRFAPGLSMWVAWPLSALFTGLVAFAIGAPALRLRREYFLITTLAFAEIIRQLVVIQADFTRGTLGIPNINRPFDSFVTGRDYNYVLLGIAVVAAAVMYLVTRQVGISPFGRTLRAARDNEAVALALGKRVNRMRIKTFILAGVLIGATAPVYLFYIRAISPQLFAPGITFTVWTALVIGGLGSIRGGLAGAFVLIVFTEAVGLIEVDPSHINILVAIEPFLVGLLLVLVLRFRPDGLFSERSAFGAGNRAAGRSAGDSRPAGAAQGSGG